MGSQRARRVRQHLACLGCFHGRGWRVGVCPRVGLPLGPSGGNAAGCLPAFSDRRRVMASILSGGVPISRAVPCAPALDDGHSGGFRKGCRACLCLLSLSWLQARFLWWLPHQFLFRPVLGT
ncbi:hypothetical protein Taro_002912 [Colocasia esculenta]|uniref:Uncharacterized protein n=1 Tax=Colocasia esculenta TaxID=4460 RepID=A0A843THT0_COLES|nr:hypothetical protein [Colocasia esculenta]